MKKAAIAILTIAILLTAASCGAKTSTATGGGTNVTYTVTLPEGWVMYDFTDDYYDNVNIVQTTDDDTADKPSIQLFAQYVGDDTDASQYLADQTAKYTDGGAAAGDTFKISGQKFMSVSTDVDGVKSETYYNFKDGCFIAVTLTNGATVKDSGCKSILSNLKISTAAK